MRSDLQIQKDVTDELRWNPLFTLFEFEILVRKSIVTIAGNVDNYPVKLSVEKAIKGITGVKGWTDDIHVILPQVSLRTDEEILMTALQTLKWHALLKDEKIRIKVRDGIIFIEGLVEWNYTRSLAIAALQNLIGVLAIVNKITLKTGKPSVNIKNRIFFALQRSACHKTAKIRVEVLGSNIILRGKVSSLAEKDDIEKIAWNTAGVSSVDNQLVVQTSEYILESI